MGVATGPLRGGDGAAPSRYALRVGEIDVLVVSDGVIQISAETMAPNADPAVLSAWLHDRFLAELAKMLRSAGNRVDIKMGILISVGYCEEVG